MVCQGCFGPSRAALCRTCFAELREPPERVLPGGVRAISAFDHTGVAAQLVHSMKYRGSGLMFQLATAALAPRIPPHAVIVYVPRCWTRYCRYGVDPSRSFAFALAKAAGGEVVPALARQLHTKRRAGSMQRGRPGPFRIRHPLKGNCLVVDDVLTTGGTVLEAVRALWPARVEFVITATSARQVSSLFVSVASSHEWAFRRDARGDG